MPAPGAAPAAAAAAIAEVAVAADAAAQAADQARGPARGEDQEMKTEESDADAAKAAADQAAPGPNAQHLRPQDGPQDPVQATYAHDAGQFECALCAYVASDLATLVAHRRAAHRGTRFTDTFSSGCRCPLLFYARVAAASHARACAQRQPPAAAVITTTARASETTRSQPPAAVPSSTPVCPPTRTEDAQPPTGPLTAVVAATATAASSGIALAATANQQSTVPAAPKHPGRQHVPPVLTPIPARHASCSAGKRRRLNATDDADMAAEPQTATAPPTPPELRRAIQSTPPLDTTAPAPTAAAPTATAPPPTTRATRWGPRPSATVPAQAMTGEQAADPAVRRPLAPAAPATGATRWGLRHRAIGAAAIARLVTGLPTTPAPPTRRRSAPLPTGLASGGREATTRDGEAATVAASTATPATLDVDGGPADPKPWLLRFDGACRRNPGPGGAGAALFDPSGKVVWTCSHFMPSSKETNNTAEYTALLLGVQSAVHHRAKRLQIEGDSNLVIAQVRGAFSCSNTKLRQLRNRVRFALRSLDRYQLTHIDRQANAHADRLANRALDQRRTSSECGPHEGSMGACLAVPMTPPAASLSARRPPPTAADTGQDDDPADEEMADVEAEIAARDGGEVFPTLPIGPDSAPARQPRLRLRQLTDDEFDAAAAALETFAADMASKIEDADSWTSGEGYIGAIPGRLRELLQPYAMQPPRSRPPHQPRQRPPRVTRNQREHRLDEALDDLEATQQATPDNRTAVRRARRRVGRI
ncbi:hypothetical protein PR001_g29364, partial [Phytophthora rubi]